MWWVYKIGIGIYRVLEPVLSLISKKAKERVKGIEHQHLVLERFHSEDHPVVWMHCASLGEFEQGRPVLEGIKAAYPGVKLVLSFFSPSGYRRMKGYEMADLVVYLPIDSPKKVNVFIEQISPSLVIWVKYEFWWNVLQVLQRKGIPSLLISAVFRKKKYPMSVMGRAFLPVLDGFDRVFVQDKESAMVLKQHGIKKVDIIGDTRVDRVLSLAQRANDLPLEVMEFVSGYKVLICGSTWPEDERVLYNLLRYEMPTDWKVILAPHEVSPARIRKIKKMFPKSGIWSEGDYCARRMLIVDNVGWLSRLYRLGAIAYVGGGFKTGLHSILEPAAYGLPIVFGMKYKKFKEAVELKECGGAFSVDSVSALHRIMEALLDESFRISASQQVLDYIQQQSGATGKVLSFIHRQYKDRLSR